MVDSSGWADVAQSLNVGASLVSEAHALECMKQHTWSCKRLQVAETWPLSLHNRLICQVHLELSPEQIKTKAQRTDVLLVWHQEKIMSVCVTDYSITSKIPHFVL
jgi:hypothetical protein